MYILPVNGHKKQHLSAEQNQMLYYHKKHQHVLFNGRFFILAEIIKVNLLQNILFESSISHK